MTSYPHQVEVYKGIEIWYDPVKRQYYASHCEHTKRGLDIETVKKWLREYKL
ncbi:MAG: hypothetical protein NWF07_04805 [Candidatus Bathyarchaeota archaeon]|nr:hypothetical protein [Candidatus Bathyarchaeota archaeon]